LNERFQTLNTFRPRSRLDHCSIGARKALADAYAESKFAAVSHICTISSNVNLKAAFVACGYADAKTG
jgi:hypothetical protein